MHLNALIFKRMLDEILQMEAADEGSGWMVGFNSSPVVRSLMVSLSGCFLGEISQMGRRASRVVAAT